MEISPSGHAATPAHDAGSAGNTLPNCSRLPSGGPLSDDDTLPVLYDMHCHLGFCPDAAGLARELSARGVGGFLCTVTPEEYQHISSPDLDPGHSNDLPSDQDPHPGPRPRWRIGVGAHPWWATDVDGDEAARIAAQAPYIGEVGLDFGKAHAATRDRQLRPVRFSQSMRCGPPIRCLTCWRIQGRSEGAHVFSIGIPTATRHFPVRWPPAVTSRSARSCCDHAAGASTHASCRRTVSCSRRTIPPRTTLPIPRRLRIRWRPPCAMASFTSRTYALWIPSRSQPKSPRRASVSSASSGSSGRHSQMEDV